MPCWSRGKGKRTVAGAFLIRHGFTSLLKTEISRFDFMRIRHYNSRESPIQLIAIMCRHLKNARGFTLIEIISVILVLGIIAAVAVPNFDKSGIEVSTWAATIETDIRYAQELAMARNPALGSPITITFSTSTNSYSLVDPSGVFDDVLRELDGTGTNIVNTISISFNRFGEAASFGTVQITAGGSTQSITVEQYTGRVTVS